MSFDSTAQRIREEAVQGWCRDLPVSYVLARCIEQKLYRAHIRRFVETLYHTFDVDFDTQFCVGRVNVTYDPTLKE